MNSPITTVFGAMTAVATILQQAFSEHGIPQTSQEWFVFAMGITTSLGLYFAKDFNVSGTPKKEDSNVKPVASALLIVGLGLSLTACSQLKELTKSFNPFVGSIESAVAELADGEYKVAVTKDGKVLYEKVIVCTKNDKELTGCHEK